MRRNCLAGPRMVLDSWPCVRRTSGPEDVSWTCHCCPGRHGGPTQLRPGPDGKEAGMFEKILLAMDDSEPSARAATLAGELGSKFGAEIVVLHVRERMIGRAGAFELETDEEAHELVDRTVAQLKDAGASARGEVAHGIAGHSARAIIEAAEVEHAGIIVMG